MLLYKDIVCEVYKNCLFGDFVDLIVAGGKVSRGGYVNILSYPSIPPHLSQRFHAVKVKLDLGEVLQNFCNA